MEAFFKNIFDLIFDRNRSAFSRAAMVCIALLTVLLINDVTGFTYYYNQKSKIEQVKALNEIVLNQSTPIEIKQKSLALEGEILNRQTSPDIAQQFVRNTYTSIRSYLSIRSTQVPSKPTPEASTPPPSKTPLQQRDNFVWLMASSGIIVVLGIIMIPVLIVMGFKQGWGAAIAALVVFETVFALVAAMFYFVLGLIPMINGSWTISYIIALLLQVTGLTLVGLAVNSSTSSSTAVD